MSGEEKVARPRGYVWGAKDRETLQAASIRVSAAKIAIDRAVAEYGAARAELVLLERKYVGVL